MPYLVQVQEDFGHEDFTLLGVTDAPAADMEPFREEHELNFPVLSEAVATREAYGIDLIWGSVFYLVDPQGTIVADALEDAVDTLEETFPARP